MSKQVEFLRELAELFNKYNVSIDESDEYDGQDNYTGTTYEIYGDGISVKINELAHAISKAWKHNE